MRRFYLASIALTVVLFLSKSVVAGSITYNVIDYPDQQDGYHVSGTITTDGTIGALTASNFLSWSLLVTNGSESHLISSADPGPGPQVTVVGDVEATASTLYLPTDVPVDQLNYILILRGGTNRIQWATVNFPPLPDAYFYSGTRPPENRVFWEHVFDIDAPGFIVASAVPEPSSIISLATALALGAGVLRRRQGAAVRSTRD